MQEAGLKKGLLSLFEKVLLFYLRVKKEASWSEKENSEHDDPQSSIRRKASCPIVQIFLQILKTKTLFVCVNSAELR